MVPAELTIPLQYVYPLIVTTPEAVKLPVIVVAPVMLAPALAVNVPSVTLRFPVDILTFPEIDVPVEPTSTLFVPYPAFNPLEDVKLAAINAAVDVNGHFVAIVSKTKMKS